MGSVVGAAIGAVILGLAETFGLAYAPTYSVVFTFVILVLVLAFRPRGHHGEARHERGRSGGSAMNSRRPRRAAARGAPRGACSLRRRPASTPRRRDAPRWLQVPAAHDRRRATCSSLRRCCSSIPFVAIAVLHLPDRRAVAGARADRAVADLPRRLRRHGVAGADDGGRHRRLRGGHLRHQQQRRDQPGLAVVARRCRSRSLIATRLRHA